VKIKASEPCPCGSGATYGDCHDRTRSEALTAVSDLEHLSLRLIPPPDPGVRSVFEKAGGTDSILFAGVSGRLSLDCGSCSAPLATRVERDQFAAIVLRCTKCGSYNDT
jgi:hypothetical protein